MPRSSSEEIRSTLSITLTILGKMCHCENYLICALVDLGLGETRKVISCFQAKNITLVDVALLSLEVGKRTREVLPPTLS